MRLIDADALVEDLKRRECELCEANVVCDGGTNVLCCECATDYTFRQIAAAPTVDVPSENHNDMVMRLVRAALCAKQPQHIMVSGEGNVSIFPDRETATKVKETDRINHWHCSRCGMEFGDSARFYKYCYECGAEFVEDE